jgi:gluconolactonase
MIVSSEVEKVAGGFQFIEGPVWLSGDEPLTSLTGARGECLVFSDIPASRLYWYRAGEIGVLREATGQANGNTLDTDGGLLSCEHQHRRVSRIDANGIVKVLADRFQGRRLNSPNDIVSRSDGMIFFTDPPYGVGADKRELAFQGVYCLNPEDGQLKLLRDDFDKPNGLAFSVDESELYIADTERGHLRQFSVVSDGGLSREQIFCKCDRPDGIRLDQVGNVWVACLNGIEVFNPNGERIAYVELPERPANLAFGDTDLKSIYICARTSIYRVRSSVAGAICPAGNMQVRQT